jgi:hypothetical protein
MTLICFLTSLTGNEKNNAARSLNMCVMIGYLVVFALAIFLVIRDMGSLHDTPTKVWAFVLAFFLPELYVILHGLSNASMGAGFFHEAMLDIPMTRGLGAASFASSLSSGHSGMHSAAESATASLSDYL